jgi:tellurite resistance protein
MPEEAKAAEGAGGPQDAAAMEFGHFIVMLASTALIHLGEMTDPTARGIERDPEQARRTIDILAMLQAKTQGNLTPEETAILERILHDLRMRYLKAIGYMKGPSP